MHTLCIMYLRYISQSHLMFPVSVFVGTVVPFILVSSNHIQMRHQDHEAYISFMLSLLKLVLRFFFFFWIPYKIRGIIRYSMASYTPVAAVKLLCTTQHNTGPRHLCTWMGWAAVSDSLFYGCALVPRWTLNALLKYDITVCHDVSKGV